MDMEVMVMKGYFKLPISLKLEPSHKMQFSIGLTPLQEIQSTYSKVLWTTAGFEFWVFPSAKEPRLVLYLSIAGKRNHEFMFFFSRTLTHQIGLEFSSLNPFSTMINSLTHVPPDTHTHYIIYKWIRSYIIFLHYVI